MNAKQVQVAGAPAAPNATAAPAPTPVIEVNNLVKTYIMGETAVHALRGVSFSINKGEYVAIIGASGSGKSTLMNMLGLLDRPTTGSYRIGGIEASRLSKDSMADLRNREIGFVFQRFNLLARTPAHRQVELPLFYAGVSGRESARRAAEALTRVGLGDRLDHRPEELSGGQQQRVAVARALVMHPGIVLADEPTGALDSHTGSELLALFDDLHTQGVTLVVVTHDMGVASRAERIIRLSDGEIVEDRRNGHAHTQGEGAYVNGAGLLAANVAQPNGHGPGPATAAAALASAQAAQAATPAASATAQGGNHAAL